MPGQFPPITPTVRTLVVVLLVCFFGQTAAEGLLQVPLTSWAALVPGLHLELAWQWATYWLFAVVQQPSDVVWHLVTIFVLYWTLSLYEAENGRGSLVRLALAGIVGAAIPLVALGALLPGLFGITAGPSPIFYAWLGALPVLRPNARIGLWVAALPPISAWTMVGIMLAISALQAAWAHQISGLVEALGGVGAGVLFARYEIRPRRAPKPAPGGGPKKRSGRPSLTVIEGGARSRDDDEDKPRWLN